MAPGDSGVTQVMTTFDNSEAADFEANDYVEFTGVMKLKTSYTEEMISDGVADYQVDYVNGTITALSTGTLQAGFSYNIEFNYVSNTKEFGPFTAKHDVFINLGYSDIGEGTVIATSSDGATTFERDTDYVMDYANGKIKVLSTGSMVDATDYQIRYGYGAVQLERGAFDVTELDVEIPLLKTNLIEGFVIVTDADGKEYNSYYEIGDGQLYTQSIDIDSYDGIGTIAVA